MADFKYWAFISYSHRDKSWGDWLHKALETYRVPKRLVGSAGRDGPVPKRLFPIFRDREELPTSADLSTNISEALKASRYLVVICSPKSAASRWVNEEVKAFKALGREDRILCLIVDGEPNASDRPETAAQECFPEAVRYRVDGSGTLTSERTEPIAADARPGKDGKSNSRLKLLAGLLGVGFDVLRQREQQRQFRFMVGAVSVSAAVALTMTVLAWFAVEQRRVAEKNEREAVHQTALARIEQGHALNMTNRWLHGFSVLTEGRSMLRRLEKPTLQADLRILESDVKAFIPYRYLNISPIKGMDVSADGALLAVANEREVHVIDFEFDRPVARVEVKGDIRFVTLSRDGARVAVGVGSGVQIFDARNGRFIQDASTKTAKIIYTEFVPGTQSAVVGASDGGIHLWDMAASKTEKLFDRDVETVAVDLSEDGKVLAVAWTDGMTQVCRLSNLRCSSTLKIPAAKPTSLALSPDGKWLISADGKLLRVWDTATGSLLREMAASAHNVRMDGNVVLYTDAEHNNFTVFDIVRGHTFGSFPSPQGILTTPRAVFARKRLAMLTTSDDGVLYWQFAFIGVPGKAAKIELPEKELLNTIGVSGNGMLTAVASERGMVRVIDTYEPGELFAFRAHDGEIHDLAFARGREIVATAGADGYAVAWTLDGGKELFRHPVRSGKPSAVALDWRGTVLAVGSDTGEVEIVDLEKRTAVTAPLRVGKTVTSLAFAPSGDELVIATAGGEVSVWAKKTGAVRKFASFDFDGHPRVRFSPTGALVVVAGSAFYFDSTTHARRRPFGTAAGLADAGFLGADLMYLVHLVDNRGVSIVNVHNGQEVAYFGERDLMPFTVGASANGDVLVVGGAEGITSYVSGFALERMDLRTRLSAMVVTEPEKSKGERAALLAAWYMSHGMYGTAQRYVEAAHDHERLLPRLAMSRFRKAAKEWDKAKERLASALEQKEVTPTYFSLATRALDAQAAAKPSGP